MAKNHIEFEGVWLLHTEGISKLGDMGYHVGKYDDKYLLFRNDGSGKGRYFKVGEFDTLEELNNMVSLLIDGG